MSRADPRFRLVLWGGLAAALLLAVGVLIERPWLSGLALAAGLTSGMLTLAALRAAQHRLREDVSGLRSQVRSLQQAVSRDGDRTRSALAPMQELSDLRSAIRTELQEGLEAEQRRLADVVGVESARLGERLRDDLDLLLRQSLTDQEALLGGTTREFTHQIEAMHSLYSRHRPRAAIRRVDGCGPTPRQTVELLEVVRRSPAGSILGLWLGDSAPWLGYEAASAESDATALVDEAAAHERMSEELAQHALDAAMTVLLAPWRPVRGSHQGQSWHDVSELPDTAVGFDLVLTGPAPGGPPTVLPLISLLADRLAPGASVALVTGASPDAERLVGAWQASHGVRVDPRLSSAEITVVRLP
ncbi:hypothetical protein BH23ACT6_BH23ACT6_20090 [soil metagenome]